MTLKNEKAQDEKTAIVTPRPFDEIVKYFSCDNCNQVFVNDYSNGGKLCSGIVAEPIRNCDLIRICQVFGDGKTHRNDIALDEAAFHVVAIQMALAQAMTFFYKRPCDDCREKSESCGPAAFGGTTDGAWERSKDG